MRDATSSDVHWIPLLLTQSDYDGIAESTSSGTELNNYDGSAEGISVGTETVRGYQVTVVRSEFPDFTEEVSVCADTLPNKVQFRWMNTVNNDDGNYFRQDMWALASVNVTVDGSILFSETFGNSTLE